MRTALAAVLALAPAPNGFTVADLTGKVHALEPDIGYTAYDLRKLRGKNLVERQGRSHRYRSTTQAAWTISALLTRREHVIAPILAGLRSPKLGRKPAAWTPVGRYDEALRIDMQNLFTHLGINSVNATAAWTTLCRSDSLKWKVGILPTSSGCPRHPPSAVRRCRSGP